MISLPRLLSLSSDGRFRASPAPGLVSPCAILAEAALSFLGLGVRQATIIICSDVN